MGSINLHFICDFSNFSSLQVLNERAVKDTELLNSRLTKLQQDFDAQLSAAEQLAQENNQKAAELKVKSF